MRLRFPSPGMVTALLVSIVALMALACTGPQGEAGQAGLPGNPGNAGASGAQGMSGEPGLSGMPGNPGNPGPPGAPGPVGPDGVEGIAGVSPGAGLMVDKPAFTISEPLTIAGSGFIWNERVNIILLSAGSLPLIVAGDVMVNEAGAFAVKVTEITGQTPDRAGGASTLVARGSSGSVATVPVNILANPISPTSPSTSIVAGVVETGGDTTIWGSGFMADEVVTIMAIGTTSDGGDRILTGDQANEFGALMLEVTISLDPGVYTLKAFGSKGSEATAPLVVVEEK